MIVFNFNNVDILFNFYILPQSHKNRQYFLFHLSHTNSTYLFMVFFFSLPFTLLFMDPTIQYTFSITFSHSLTLPIMHNLLGSSTTTLV